MTPDKNAQIFNIIEQHLSNRTGVISIVQGAAKRRKENASHNRFLWSKKDVLSVAPSIKAFIEDLPNHGFTNGAVLYLKRMEGSSAKVRSETTLTFSNQTPKETPSPTQTDANMNTQTPQNTQHQVAAPQMAAPVSGMGYTQVPQHELISMKVKEERFIDLSEKLKKAESELADVKSELRIEKEKCHTAEKKLETIIDRKDFEKQQALANKESALEKLMNNEAIANGLGTLLSKTPELLESIKGKPTAVGMGNPMANMSKTKQQLMALLQDYPDEAVLLIIQTAQGLLASDDFQTYLVTGLNQLEQQKQS
ncbi:hypothetical protein [Algibacter sp. PT7-4]|uniref:hypothetical protein n=1 Tax=Algibacter ulvanivorans TaxID=3400999 RepID=UPI003AAF6E5A